MLNSSRLDFGNALLFSLPQTQLSRLQKLQNAAVRIINPVYLRNTLISPLFWNHFIGYK